MDLIGARFGNEAEGSTGSVTGLGLKAAGLDVELGEGLDGKGYSWR